MLSHAARPPRDRAPGAMVRRDRRSRPAVRRAAPARSQARCWSRHRPAIRKPRRLASAASASASVSPPALSSLILMASYFPSSRSRSARVRQDLSAQSGIGCSNRASASSALAGSGCSISATPQIDQHWHVFAKLRLIPALVGIDDEARRRRRLPAPPAPVRHRRRPKIPI